MLIFVVEKYNCDMFVHPSNISVPIYVTVDGIDKELNKIQSLKHSFPIDSTPSCISTRLNPEQPEKHEVPTVEMLEGIVTELKVTQFWKQLFPKIVFWTTTEFKEEQP